nr:uncharacterized protein LOC127313726 [Lolium perenne]
MSLETSVQAKVFGKEAHIPNESVLVVRRAEDNIGKNLIQQFDDESDDDVEDINVGMEVIVSSKPDLPVPPMAWKEKKQWGPVQATRMSSRIPRDGKSVTEKAQDLKKEKNLEIPKANQRRRKKQICKLQGEDGMVEDNKGIVAPLTLQRCSVEDSVEGGRKRGAGGDVEQDGGGGGVARLPPLLLWPEPG